MLDLGTPQGLICNDIVQILQHLNTSITVVLESKIYKILQDHKNSFTAAPNAKLPLANWLRQARKVWNSPKPVKTHTAVGYMTYTSSLCSCAVGNLAGSKDWHFRCVTDSLCSSSDRSRLEF